MEWLSFQSEGAIGERSGREPVLPAELEEDWTKISNLAERRRIQNRIAQRNYRKKLKERLNHLQRRAGRDAKNTSRTRDSSSEGNKLEITEDDGGSENHPIAGGSAWQPLAPHLPSSTFVNPVKQSEHETSLPSPASSDFLMASSSQDDVTRSSKREPRPKGIPVSQPRLPVDFMTSSADYENRHKRDRQSTSVASDPAYSVGVSDSMELDQTWPDQVQTNPATFQCSLCPKRFTRANTLRSHLRTHTDERPFVCAVCGKAFAQQHDRKQHEGLHATVKNYVCGGDVDNGFHWGCGRRFPRAGGLRRHFRSETGKICVKSLREQVNVQKDGDEAVAELPAALVARYPFLETANWTKSDEEDQFNDDRSRFDSSDYESDDAGYISGTETGSIMKTALKLPLPSSTRSKMNTANRFQPLADSAHDPCRDGRRTGSQAFSQPPYDRSSGVVTPKVKPRLPSLARRFSNVGEEIPIIHREQEDDSQSKHEEFTNTDVPNEGFSDTCDDNMSLRSFTESVFDVGSVLSSASSSHSNSHVMVASFVEILLLDPNMDRLLAITTSEFGVSSGRFTRNFSRILKSYSRHLRQAIKGLWLPKDVQDRLVVASKAVCNCRHQISSLIAARYNERAPSAEAYQHKTFHIISRHLDQVRVGRGDNYELSSNEESGGEEADFTTADVKEFLVSGEPFWLLKRNLRSLVIPDRFLECIYESGSAFLDLLLAEKQIRSTVHGLRHELLFGRNIQSGLSTQFRLMATRLRTECANTAQLDASIFLETYAEYISIIATDHINVTYTSQGRSVLGSAQMPDKSRHIASPLPHEHVLEQILAETLPSVLYVDLVPHWKFLASSEAFSFLADALRDLAYPTFFSEAKKFILGDSIQPPNSSENRIPELEGQRLLAIIAEMESCLLYGDNRIYFSVNPLLSGVGAMDRMKLWIEASTASEWDWWPLQPPSRSRAEGKAELSWRCSCGSIRQEATLKSYAIELRRIFNNFPLSHTHSGGQPDRPTSSLSNTSSQSPRSTQSTSSSFTNYGGKQSFSSSSSSPHSAITPPDDGDDSVLDFGNGSRRYIYVFILVKTSEYILETIDLSLMTTRDFFQAIRAVYMKNRSLWRRVFSVFVYSHCDFIKIMKPEPETFIPGDLSFELPPDHDDEYHYRPRPTYAAPVTRHMFRHYFYGCYERESLWHRLHSCVPLVPKCRIRNPAGEMLDFFPKRDRPVTTASHSEKVEVCYGIAARECRSFFRVLVYLCLIMAPALWFVFAWLFMWGDRGDLQDATIPMTLMMGMLSILWAVIHSGSDVRKAYGEA